MAIMLLTRDGANVDPDIHMRKAFEAIRRAEYAQLEDAHKGRHHCAQLLGLSTRRG